MTSTIELPIWVHRGKMYIRRDTLDSDDPDHPYNYIKRTYNVDPTLYGIKMPEKKKCPCCGSTSYESGLNDPWQWEDPAKYGF